MTPRTVDLARGGRRRRLRSRVGFTLVEVLATMVLIGIVIPVAMRGVSVALNTASAAKRQAEAATLGEAKLNELVSLGDWTAGATSGDFGQDWPDYRWRLQTVARDFDVTEIVLTVQWSERGQERVLNLSTLATATTGVIGGGVGTGVVP
jgi:prepilin-type N-terminal cleavage/methylation domain-containing protein